MAQRLFDQMDNLECGARMETRQTRHSLYNNSSAEFSAYDGQEPGYYENAYYHQGLQYEQSGIVDEPMTLDSFDEQLLRQPDHNSRHGQAALGRARLSLPPGCAHPAVENIANDFIYGPSLPPTHNDPRRLDLSRFTFDTGQTGSSSSSPFNQPLPSSPAFNASQRRPAPEEYGRHMQTLFPGHSLATTEEPSTYQPRSVDDLEAEGYYRQTPQVEPTEYFRPRSGATHPISKPKHTNAGPPVVQGISLVSTHALPDRFRSIFPYPLFNAVQSKSFDTIYKTNDNFVLSAPTGSGKTAVLELAICRLVNGFTNGTYKIVYQAPTKSLCSERQRDWQTKFAPLDLQCAELTGDTDNAQLRNVQRASIIITTPEKWDSMTRKWKDHQRLMQMVKLFFIDEVHILKDDRGSTLEAVVSRMKSVGSDVRFVALSATVPNSQDISTWLGKDPMHPHVPAPRERFGEEFRPVRLQKHVCGYQSNSNDFAFEKTLNAKLPDVIVKWSQRKPIMVFCFTRTACVDTAKLLANWWTAEGPRERYWSSPRKQVVVAEKDLRHTISSGVAFHHAGLTIQDRTAVEKAYLEGDINVICCTSTLAVGINLPCQMVIIKNTVTYYHAGGCKEYSDLEIMQMLGRAGRPQFDDSAVAVIMTRAHRVPYYEKMISGQEILESCLHRNLIDHLNAEIGLGTVTSASSAKKWLSGTFLYVRLKDNPEHYKIEGGSPGRNLDERLENICNKAVAMLEENNLVEARPKLHCTEFGDAMARYYLQFDTMKVILALPDKAKVSEILSAISQAAEFKDIRFRAGEKPTYKSLNKNSSIKFPIPVNLDAPAHKVSLVVQAVLGAVELPSEDYKQRMEYNTAKAIVFQHAPRLIRCIIDCQLYLEDAVTIRNALMLARSLGAQVWDDSPLHMRQLEGIGLIFVRKLVSAGIMSIEDIENAEGHQIEQALTRHPPYGIQLQEKAKAFPKLRVSLKMIGEPIRRKGEHVSIRLKADIGFLNEKVPETFQRKPVYVCLLAETSDGHKVHFARISAKKLNKGQDVLFSANLTSASQTVWAYVMCDELAGTMRYAKLRPEIPPLAFPLHKTAEAINDQRTLVTHAPNTSKRRASGSKARSIRDNDGDEFGDGDIDDSDLVRAEAGDFVDIDEFDVSNDRRQPKQKKSKTSAAMESNETWEPQQLPSGKWACNHACKNKAACKHLCCREGVDKKPKPPKSTQSHKKQAEPGDDPKQTQLNISVAKTSALPTSAIRSAEKAPASVPRKINPSKEARDLDRLHSSVKTKTPAVPVIGQSHRSSEAGQPYVKGGKSGLSFLQAARAVEEEDDGMSDDGGDGWDSNDLPNTSDLFGSRPGSRTNQARVVGGNERVYEVPDAVYKADEGSGFFQPLDEDNGDGHVDLSSYTNGENVQRGRTWHINDHEDDGDEYYTATPPRDISKTFGRGEHGEHIFVGYSNDSVTLDLGVRTINKNQESHLTGEDLDQSEPFATGKEQKAASASPTSSAQFCREVERMHRVIPADDFLTRVADATAAEPQGEERPNSPDELQNWFEEEFGTEHFHYIG